MKGYGLPRSTNVEAPDCGDILFYALKSSASHIPGKGGDIRNSIRSIEKKHRIRRIHKKIERSRAKAELAKEFD